MYGFGNWNIDCHIPYILEIFFKFYHNHDFKCEMGSEVPSFLISHKLLDTKIMKNEIGNMHL